MLDLSFYKVIKNLIYYLSTNEYVQTLNIDLWRTFDDSRMGDETIISLFPYSESRSEDGSVTYKNTEIGSDQGLLVTYRLIIKLQYNGNKDSRVFTVDRPKTSLVDFQDTYTSKVELDTSLPVLLEGLELISLVLMNMPEHKKKSYGISSINPVSINFLSTPRSDDLFSQREAELLIDVETRQRRNWTPSKSSIEEISLTLTTK